MVMYREVCPEGVQNKCPGGVWCRGFMSGGGGDTLILVISRGVQLYYGIAHRARNYNNFGCLQYARHATLPASYSQPHLQLRRPYNWRVYQTHWAIP